PTYTKAMAAAIEAFTPDVVVGPASPMGTDLFPRLAARCNAGLASDVTSCKAEGGAVHVTKPLHAGKILADVTLSGAGPKLVTLRANVFAAQKTGKGAANAKPLSVDLASDIPLKIKEIRKGTTEKPDLTESSIIISGGR